MEKATVLSVITPRHLRMRRGYEMTSYVTFNVIDAYDLNFLTNNQFLKKYDWLNLLYYTLYFKEINIHPKSMWRRIYGPYRKFCSNVSEFP
jgi:hypothetical protein